MRHFVIGKGCAHCHNTGYRGRIGVFELLELDRAMGNALRDSDVLAFNKAAHNSPHFHPLSYSAMEFAVKGITSLGEVLRVSALVEDESIDEA